LKEHTPTHAILNAQNKHIKNEKLYGSKWLLLLHHKQLQL